MHILVLGCEDLGANLAASLARDGHRVTVMDSSPARLNSLLQESQVEAVLASDSLMEDLRGVGMNDVDAMLAISEDDNRNAMAAQIASHIFHVPEVICRVSDPHREKVYAELGIKVVCPSLVVMDTIKRALKNTPEAAKG